MSIPWAFMGNAYWDIETNTMFTPYLGLGIGAAHVDFDTVGGEDDWEFAYQGMAGASCRRLRLKPLWASSTAISPRPKSKVPTTTTMPFWLHCAAASNVSNG
jgi:hypothetical protein